MVLGVGTDLVKIERIAVLLTRFGDRFKRRCFTDQEIKRVETKSNINAGFAKYFAAKEACVKALGTGVASGVFWRDIGVVSSSSGQPRLSLTGGALKRLNDMTPSGMVTRVDLSLADEPPFAQAFVVISAQ